MFHFRVLEDYGLLEGLISDSHVATAHHLSQIVQHLRTGMKARGLHESQKEWTLHDELAKWNPEPTKSNRRTYLNDYRRMFLSVWLSRIRDKSMAHESCCFQPAGITNGHYAAQRLAHALRSMVDGPATPATRAPDETDLDAGLEGGFGLAGRQENDLERIRYTPMAAAGVLRYLHTNFGDEKKSE